MRLLVLGGSVFLSRAVASRALADGHEVTCACRGRSGPVPDGATHLVLDREASDGSELAERATEWDAVVEVARTPSFVRTAVAAVPDAHWVFVSTVNVYADNGVPDGTPDTLELLAPLDRDEDPAASPETYGAMKVACERLVSTGAASSTVVRPGLVVGPDDPTGRFGYWPARLADGGEVLAPGDPGDPVQVVDVRDLAAWLVGCAARRTTGVFDGIGAPVSRADFLAQVAAGVAAEPELTWVDQDFLVEHEVVPWSGPGSLPLWLPLPEYAGLLSHDVRASYDAGLVTRPLSETARDTLSWLRATPEATTTGLTREREAELLEAWHASRTGRR